MRRDEGYAAATLAVVMGGAVAVAIAADIAAPACSSAKAHLADIKDFDFGCFEFWLNRYQTSMQTAVTAVLTIVGLLFVIRQLRELTRQNRMTAEALNVTIRAEKRAQKATRVRAAFALETYLTGTALLFQRSARMMEPDYVSLDDAQFWTDMRMKQPEISAGADDPDLAGKWEELRREFDLLFAYLQTLRNKRGIEVLDYMLRPGDRFPADLEDARMRLSHLVAEMWALRETLLVKQSD